MSFVVAPVLRGSDKPLVLIDIVLSQIDASDRHAAPFATCYELEAIANMAIRIFKNVSLPPKPPDQSNHCRDALTIRYYQIPTLNDGDNTIV